MRYLRTVALALALAFLILPAAPLGGIVPNVGGEAHALAGPIPCEVDSSQPGCDGGGDGGGYMDFLCMTTYAAGTWAVHAAYVSWVGGVPTTGGTLLLGAYGFFGNMVFC